MRGYQHEAVTAGGNTKQLYAVWVIDGRQSVQVLEKLRRFTRQLRLSNALDGHRLLVTQTHRHTHHVDHSNSTHHSITQLTV